MSSILGNEHYLDSLRGLQARTRADSVDLYNAGADDGRGGIGDPALVTEGVEAAAKPMTGEDAMNYLGERLVTRDPHQFFLPPDVTPPDDCYVLYNGTLYDVKNRLHNDVTLRLMGVRAQDQSTA